MARDAGTLDERRVRKVFTSMLKAAGLPLHFSPHCLRHTFAPSPDVREYGLTGKIKAELDDVWTGHHPAVLLRGEVKRSGLPASAWVQAKTYAKRFAKMREGAL